MAGEALLNLVCGIMHVVLLINFFCKIFIELVCSTYHIIMMSCRMAFQELVQDLSMAQLVQ